MKYLKTIIVANFIWLGFAHVPLAAQRNYSFSASGEESFVTTFHYLPSFVSNNVTLFTVNFDQGSWQIQTEQKGSGFDQRLVVGSTNDEIYSVLYIRPTNSTTWICSSASARPGPVPYVDGNPVVSILWIAFLGQEQITNDGRQLLPPVFAPYKPDVLALTRVLMPADVTRSSSPPYFISNYTVYLDKWRYWEDGVDAMASPPLEMPLPKPYEHGCTNYIYQVDEFKTDGFATWPEQMSLVQCLMKNGAENSNDVAAVSTVKLKVLVYSTNHSDVIFIPQIEKGVLVNEQRFIFDNPPVSSFDYVSSGDWLSKSQVADSQQYKARLKKQKILTAIILSRVHDKPQLYPGARRKQALLVICFMCISILAVFIFLHKQYTNNNDKI